MSSTRHRFALGIVALTIAFGGPVAATALADEPPSPSVVTLAATDVTATSAQLHATVLTNGTPTTAHFVYGTAPDQLLSSTPDTSVGSGAGEIPVAATIMLKANTKYYFRAVAENDDWVVTGDQRELTTQLPPGVKSAAETDITYRSATVHVTVTTQGAPVTVAGEVAAAGGTPIKLGPVTVTTDGDVAFPVAALAPSTTYRWVITGSGAGGLAGARGSFRTANLLPTPPVELPTTPVRYGTQVTAAGTLVGGANLTVTLVEQPFPFTAPIAPVPGVTTLSDASGRFSFPFRAERPTSFGVTADGFQPITSNLMAKLKVFPDVKAKVKRALRGRFVVSGTSLPSGVSGKASLFRKGAGKVGLSVPTSGSFRFPARALKPGQYEVKVVPAASTGYDAGKSATFTVPKVKKQKPRR